MLIPNRGEACSNLGQSRKGASRQAGSKSPFPAYLVPQKHQRETIWNHNFCLILPPAALPLLGDSPVLLQEVRSKRTEDQSAQSSSGLERAMDRKQVAHCDQGGRLSSMSCLGLLVATCMTAFSVTKPKIGNARCYLVWL